jgi:hypothetical protein
MTLALEINDVGLVLARDGAIVGEEPGCAMLDGREPETGAAAARRLRLKPLFAETRHWQDLSTEPLPRATPAAGTFAEIAHAQLVALRAILGAADRQLLVAVPAWYTREQLGLLLGISTEAGLDVVGLVDAAVAAAALEPAPESVIQLELAMQRSVVTVLEHGGDLRRARYDLLPRLGWSALQQAWLELIAAAFVRKTRFDPLREAANEQLLWDGLPGWIDELQHAPQVNIQITAGGHSHEVELPRESFATAAARIYDGVVQAVQRSRPAAGPMQVRVSHRWAALPGFLERLQALRDCDVLTLPRGAAALGALAYESAVRRPPGALALVQRLAVPRRAAEGPAAATGTAVPVADRPTHVVFRSRAWTILREPLTLGAGVTDGARGLSVPAGPGISRRHCTIARADDGVWLVDQSTYGTYVNGERVTGRVALRAGDRLRIGSPGLECELVRVVDGDGAA